ncbi:MAG: aminodeoxychorismate/anthranilate synthase component II [Bacilli bacterium]
MILMIDNYDSFTYNLVQYFGSLGEELQVVRNDEITLSEIEAMKPDYLVVSPGPCTPNEAGISMDVIRTFAGKIPIFGVCLGHQSIAQAFGGVIVRSEAMMHGKTSQVTHDAQGIYQGMPQPFTACRYHSLTVREQDLPSCLVVTARAESGEIMGLRHRTLPIESVQFHPESILTEQGIELLRNFVTVYRKGPKDDVARV